MIEVEIKIPIADRVILEQKLHENGFVQGKRVKESDTYFNSEGYDLRKMDMALRIRSCKDLDTKELKSFVTYKGPKMDQVSMTRKELETGIEDAEIGKELILSLGFYSLPSVIKVRQYYHLKEITACVDQVESLGDFLELEILVKKEQDREEALMILKTVLAKVGLDWDNVTRTSYLSMLLNL